MTQYRFFVSCLVGSDRVAVPHLSTGPSGGSTSPFTTTLPARPPQARDGDASLNAASSSARPLPSDSLVWKYLATSRSAARTAGRHHRKHVSPTWAKRFRPLGDLHRSDCAGEAIVPPSHEAVYGRCPEKTGLQIRNFHKPPVRNVSDGSKFDGQPYSGLDPQTFDRAHATFLDMLYQTTERFIRRLTDAEKEQIFQESRDWYSLYGMDDAGTPSTYREFCDSTWIASSRRTWSATPRSRNTRSATSPGTSRAHFRHPRAYRSRCGTTYSRRSSTVWPPFSVPGDSTRRCAGNLQLAGREVRTFATACSAPRCARRVRRGNASRP